MPKLTSIKKKLAKHPLSPLTPKELKVYFIYRLHNLLGQKRVLVRRELEYLLGETGPGMLRIDPELLHSLTDEQIFTDSLMAHFTEMTGAITNQKTKIQERISEDLCSQEAAKLMATLLGHYIQSLEIRTLHPLVFKGSFEQVPVHVLVINGGWLMPDRILLGFLGEAQRSQSLPLVIAKKIHGILFPLFKSQNPAAGFVGSLGGIRGRFRCYLALQAGCR